jgi:hypothetical protein
VRALLAPASLGPGMDASDFNIREMVTALAVGLLVGLLASWAAIYGMDRFLVPEDQPAVIKTLGRSDRL